MTSRPVGQEGHCFLVVYLAIIIRIRIKRFQTRRKRTFFFFCLRMMLTSREKISVTFYLILSNHDTNSNQTIPNTPLANIFSLLSANQASRNLLTCQSEAL